jgi:hypothetical protein
MPAAPVLPEPPTAVRIAVLYRPGKGKGRWKKIGTATNYAEAVTLVNAAGDYWFRIDRVENDDQGPGLFDEEG